VTPSCTSTASPPAQPPPQSNKFKVTAHEVYTGSFSDDSLMATCAKTFVSGDKADVLTGSSSRSSGYRRREVGSPGVVRHAVNQSTLAPSNVVSSQVYNWDPILRQMFTAIRGGTLGDATYVIGLGNGGEKIQFNSGLQALPRHQGPRREADLRDHQRDITVPQ